MPVIKGFPKAWPDSRELLMWQWMLSINTHSLSWNTMLCLSCMLQLYILWNISHLMSVCVCVPSPGHVSRAECGRAGAADPPPAMRSLPGRSLPGPAPLAQRPRGRLPTPARGLQGPLRSHPGTQVLLWVLQAGALQPQADRMRTQVLWNLYLWSAKVRRRDLIFMLSVRMNGYVYFLGNYSWEITEMSSCQCVWYVSCLSGKIGLSFNDHVMMMEE